MLAAHRRVLRALPEALLVLVPRHPERLDLVARLVSEEGFTIARRSAEAACDRQVQVFIGDSMGEMLAYYGVSDLCYVGGSLVPTGSHNMLEPAALGRAVLFGPHRFNFADISRRLIEVGGAFEVIDADALARQVIELLGDDARRAAMGDAGRAFVSANKGSLARLLEMVNSLK